MRRHGRGLRRWGIGTQPIGQNLISKLGVGGSFNRAITSGMFQNAHRATIEWMAGEHHILFVCLSRFLTILLILLFVMYREMQADLWFSEPEETERPASHAAFDLLDDLSSPRRKGSSAVPKVIAAASGAV
jgi:hypothetical protein